MFNYNEFKHIHFAKRDSDFESLLYIVNNFRAVNCSIKTSEISHSKFESAMSFLNNCHYVFLGLCPNF